MLHGYLSHVYADLVSPPLSANVRVEMLVRGGGGPTTALSGNDPWVSVCLLLVLAALFAEQQFGDYDYCYYYNYYYLLFLLLA